MIFEVPSIQKVNYLHTLIINEYGGDDGIRSKSDLEAALKSPFATFDGKDLYTSNLEKCCKVFEAIIVHHPYVDGNKRLGMMVFQLCLWTYGHNYKSLSNSDYYNCAMKLATSVWDYRDTYEYVDNKIQHINN